MNLGEGGALQQWCWFVLFTSCYLATQPCNTAFTVNLFNFKDVSETTRKLGQSCGIISLHKNPCSLQSKQRSILSLGDEAEGKTVLRVIAHKGLGSPCTPFASGLVQTLDIYSSEVPPRPAACQMPSNVFSVFLFSPSFSSDRLPPAVPHSASGELSWPLALVLQKVHFCLSSESECVFRVFPSLISSHFCCFP